MRGTSETPVIDDATIEELPNRLRAMRWPDAPAGTGRRWRQPLEWTGQPL